jgi:hypothetical protein
MKMTVSERNRLGNRTRLGQRPQTLHQRSEFLGVARREHYGMTRLDPQRSDCAADMAGADDAYFQRPGRLSESPARSGGDGKGEDCKGAGTQKRTAVEAGAVSIRHDFLPEFLGRERSRGLTPGHANYSNA